MTTLPTYVQMKLLVSAMQARRDYHRHVEEEWFGQAERDKQKEMDYISLAIDSGLSQEDVAEYMQREDGS